MERENILRWFQDTAERRGTEPCLRYKKDNIWRSIDWNQSLEQVQILSEALKKIGIGKGDRVSILATTRYEWTLYDIAILSLGAITVPIYQSSRAEECEHILQDSTAKAIIVEDSTQLEKVLQIRSKLPSLQQIVLLEGKVMGGQVITHEEFLASVAGIESDFGSRIRQIKLDDPASFVYTSGTTGKPKGVVLTHGNFLSEVKAIGDCMAVPAHFTSLFFLPLAHILARVLQFYQITYGFTHAYAESIDKMGDNIQEIRPQFMVSVPRIFEKIYSGMMAQVENSSSLRQGIFFWAKRVGEKFSDDSIHGRPLSLGLKIRQKVANKLVFSKLHKKLGGRMEFFVSGGAPLSKDIAEFFYGAGIPILEGYGLTETTAAVNLNTLENIRFGTVGKPVMGCEQKIAKDGEILVRGPMIVKEYWNCPEATQEVFQSDGWFHTGDIGEFVDGGFLKITDRKKDIIVTAGGKNIAPQNIENMIKTDPLISQVVVHGDKRKFLSALVTLNPDELPSKAATLGVAKASFATMSQDPKVKELVKKIVDRFNDKLPKYETIKKFVILDKDFSIEDGELTPTMKVKRKVISERYQDILDGFYND